MLRRFPLTFSPERGWHVALPTYAMIPGTWLPKIAGGVPIPAHINSTTGAAVPAGVADVCDGNGIHHRVQPNDPRIANLSCEVEFPDDYFGNAAGDLDVANLRLKYKGNPLWDRADLVPPRPAVPIPEKP
jgi:hypothetical protein